MIKQKRQFVVDFTRPFYEVTKEIEDILPQIARAFEDMLRHLNDNEVFTMMKIDLVIEAETIDVEQNKTPD